MEIPRRHTQLFAELAGEIIVVAKSALCRDIGDPVGRHQHQQGFFQAELQQILPRRDSGDFRKMMAKTAVDRGKAIFFLSRGIFSA